MVTVSIAATVPNTDSTVDMVVLLAAVMVMVSVKVVPMTVSIAATFSASCFSMRTISTKVPPMTVSIALTLTVPALRRVTSCW